MYTDATKHAHIIYNLCNHWAIQYSSTVVPLGDRQTDREMYRNKGTCKTQQLDKNKGKYSTQQKAEYIQITRCWHEIHNLFLLVLAVSVISLLASFFPLGALEESK